MGDKKGKKCGKGCRGDYCKDHNKSKKEYEKKRYQKIAEKKKEQDRLTKVDPILEQINKATDRCQLPNSAMIFNKARIALNEARLAHTKCIAARVRKGEIDLEEGKAIVGYRREFKYNKYVEKYREKTNEQIEKVYNTQKRKVHRLREKYKIIISYLPLIDAKIKELKEDDTSSESEYEEYDDIEQDMKGSVMRSSKIIRHKPYEDELEISDSDILSDSGNGEILTHRESEQNIDSLTIKEKPKKKYIEI
jgi:hypothetical protein